MKGLADLRYVIAQVGEDAAYELATYSWALSVAAPSCHARARCLTLV
ncbi:hypothetical protein [Streptomyces sp. 147326]